MVDEVLEKIQEAMHEYRREVELAEEANKMFEKSIKGLIEKLKVELQNAQLEDRPATENLELSQMLVGDGIL